MTIIFLDTNIFFSDWSFKKSEYQAFLDFLHKTDSKVFMPPVIWAEIESKYRITLEENINVLNSALENINKKPLWPVNKMIQPESLIKKYEQITHINIDEQVNYYLANIEKMLGIKQHMHLNYPSKSDILPMLVKKALNRSRPFSQKGEGFRDALIWQSILDVKTKEENKNFIFISNDGSGSSNAGFGINNQGNRVLHPDLQKEWDENNRGNTINFYESIEAFIKVQGEEFPSISKEDVLKMFSNEHIFNQFKESITPYLLTLLEKFDHIVRAPQYYDPALAPVDTVFFDANSFAIEEYDFAGNDVNFYIFQDKRIQISFTIIGKFSIGIFGNLGLDFSHISTRAATSFLASVVLIKEGDEISIQPGNSTAANLDYKKSLINSMKEIN